MPVPGAESFVVRVGPERAVVRGVGDGYEFGPERRCRGRRGCPQQCDALAQMVGVGADAPDAPRRPDLVSIPDTPYDGSLWTDSDDEGLGARDRRAP